MMVMYELPVNMDVVKHTLLKKWLDYMKEPASVTKTGYQLPVNMDVAKHTLLKKWLDYMKEPASVTKTGYQSVAVSPSNIFRICLEGVIRQCV